MIRSKVANRELSSSFSQKVNDYKLLVKFRLSSLVIFSSVMAYFIAAQGSISWMAVGILALGGFLVTGAANALNQVLERDFDRLMKRTADRPLATQRMTVSEAVMAAGFMSMFGIVLLATFNAWTALLGTLALISYAFVYTPMKRISPMAVMVAAIPGALPMMIGCVAAEGEITALAWALFGIQLLWQFPHFWAIAWLGHEDYSNAGFNLLPTRSGEPDDLAGWQSFIYALLLIPVSLMPYALGMTGLISAVLVLGLGLAYAGYGWNMYRKCTREAARKLMFSSFFYLPLVLIILLADKL